MDINSNKASLPKGTWVGLIAVVALIGSAAQLSEIASELLIVASVLSLPVWLSLFFGSIAAILALLGLMTIRLDRMTISLDRHPTLNKALKVVAGSYMVSIFALGLLALLRYEFTWASINFVLNIASLVLIVPTLFALYINRSTKWTRISLASLPIVILFIAPYPTAVEARFLIFLVAAPSFFLSDAKRWQRRIMRVPIGALAGLLVVLLPYSIISGLVGESATTTSLSPDRKHEIEVSGTSLGALGGSVTAAQYRVHPGAAIRKFERFIATSYDLPLRPEIQWLDNDTVIIQGQRFYLGHRE